VVKNNHYSTGSYCTNVAFCPGDRTATNPASPEAYYVSQVNSNLALEWSFQSTNTKSCQRNSDGTLTCVADHPSGFEWCVNAPVIDVGGIVYANSEDGNLYAIGQGGVQKQIIFQQLAIGAAYTPASLGGDGKVYTQNFGIFCGWEIGLLDHRFLWSWLCYILLPHESGQFTILAYAINRESLIVHHHVIPAASVRAANRLSVRFCNPSLPSNPSGVIAPVNTIGNLRSVRLSCSTIRYPPSCPFRG